MKIIVTVSDQVWGGKQRVMLDVLNGLVGAGHAVHLLAEEGSPMARTCHAAGISTEEVPLFSAEGAGDAVLAALRQQRPHLIIGCGRADAEAIREAREQYTGELAFVLFRHSAFPLGTLDEVRPLFSVVDLCIPTSGEMKTRQIDPLVAAGLLREDQVELILSGLNEEVLEKLSTADRDQARASLGIDPEPFAFLVSGRLAWEKGIDRVVGSFAALEDEVPPLLLIAGEGVLEQDLRDQAAELGIADRVLFLGHLDDVTPAYAACDALVFATIVPEPGPLSIKEAMAAGRPVISSAMGGISEFFQDERHGLLIIDDEDIVEAMRTLLNDRVAAAAMGAAGQEEILGRHRVSRRLEHLMRLLDHLAIDRLGPEAVLGDLEWDDVRLRPEAEGGFVFVPRTSQLMEVDGTTYEVVRAAVEAKDPGLLAKATDPTPAVLTGRLYDMGALVRP